MNNKLLVVAEKKHMAQQFLKALPDLQTQYDINIVDFRGMGLFRFDLPSELPISEVPRIMPIAWKFLDIKTLSFYKEKPTSWWVNFAYAYSTIEAGIVPLKGLKPGLDSIEKQINYVKSTLMDYDRILIVPDADHRGMFFGHQITRYLLNDTPFPRENIDCLFFNTGLDKRSVVEAYEKRQSYSEEGNDFSQYGEVKYYFDWLWQINSAPVFGKALKMAGAKTDTILSKYELLTFLLLAKNKLPFRLNDNTTLNGSCLISSSMERFMGSGKYPKDKFDKDFWHQGIGSASSRSTIVENLIERKLVDENLQLTPEGERFYTFVHKRSFDPDLAYRLDQWCLQRDIAGIEKYIKGFFKRQKNFNSSSGLN